MEKTIDSGPLKRDLVASEFRLAKSDKGAEIEFSASSELPVDRSFGTEVLVHEPGAIRMQRIDSRSAPLLWNHNWDDPIGMVDGARLEDKRLKVRAHFFDTERAKEVRSMIEGGLRNISVGYQLHEIKESKGTYRAVDWEPLEFSVVTVPADASIGIGRGVEEKVVAVRVTADQVQTADDAISVRSVSMEAEVNASAGKSADVQVIDDNTHKRLSDARASELTKLAEKYDVDLGTLRRWIEGDVTIKDAAEETTRIIHKRTQEEKVPATKLGFGKYETERYSLLRAIQAVADQNWSKAGLELEAHQQIAKRLNSQPDPKKFYVPLDVQGRTIGGYQHPTMQGMDHGIMLGGKRDLTVGTAANGGYLVGTDNMSFIEMLRNRSVVMRMGATRMSGLVGNVTVPRQTAAATAVWLANEASTITESQQTLGQLSLTPKTVGAYTEISRQLLLQSSPGAESVVTNDLAAVAAIAVDLAALEGSGASGQPTGISGTAGIGSVTGTSLGYAGIVEFQTDVAAGNVTPMRGGYVTTPAVAGLLKQRARFSNTDTPVWQGNIWDGAIEGFPAMSSNQLTAATMIFGDWSSLIVAEWGVLEIEVNPYANFQAGIVGVRAMYTVDVGVRYPVAFSRATTIT